jgi:hypothetical protein
LKRGHDAAAAGIDGQHLVVNAMRHEHPRVSAVCVGAMKPGEKARM